jgi:hypothetical protein
MAVEPTRLAPHPKALGTRCGRHWTRQTGTNLATGCLSRAMMISSPASTRGVGVNLPVAPPERVATRTCVPMALGNTPGFMPRRRLVREAGPDASGERVDDRRASDLASLSNPSAYRAPRGGQDKLRVQNRHCLFQLSLVVIAKAMVALLIFSFKFVVVSLPVAAVSSRAHGTLHCRSRDRASPSTLAPRPRTN